MNAPPESVRTAWSWIVVVALCGPACTVEPVEDKPNFGDPYEDPDEDLDQAREDYLRLGKGVYASALDSATALHTAIASFVADPSEGALIQTKVAYLAAHDAWAATEALRFSAGPVDGRWDRINAWQLDPGYVDYTELDAEAGIINDPTTYPTIDTAALIKANQSGGDRNISAGYHVIEFLLWGEDLYADAPGKRSAADYSSAPNADRRAQYLLAAADLLVEDLQYLASQWADNGTHTGQILTMERTDVMHAMLEGIRRLAGFELAGNFVGPGLDFDPEGDPEGDPEAVIPLDELSPFADRTEEAFASTVASFVAVYRGQLGEAKLSGLETAISARDQDLDQRIQVALDDLESGVAGLTGPYEKTVLPGGEDRAQLEALEAQLWALGLLMEEAADLFVAEETP